MRILVLSLLATAYACGPSAAPPAMGVMPAFELSSLGGTQVANADLAGKVVLYDLWATWCGPCHLQADILREIYPDLRSKGVEIVGIATGEEPATVREFAAHRPFPWPILLDPEEKVSNELEVMGLPTLVLTCKGGAISFRQTGVVTAGQLQSQIARAQSC